MSIDDCAGEIFDSGNLGSGYSANENYTFTLCPSVPGLKSTVTFTSFDLHVSDELCIYDGATNIAPLIGCFTGSDINGVTFNAFDDCLTFEFTSDASLQATGWQAEISCNNCQKIVPDASTDPAGSQNLTNFIDICQGETVTFTAQPDFPENNTNYNQDLNSSTFFWDFFNATSQEQNPTNEYFLPGYYPVYLTVNDVNNCSRTKEIYVVRVAGEPQYNVSLDNLNPLAGPTEVCMGADFQLNAQAQTEEYTFVYSDNGDPVFLDDVLGGQFASSIQMQDFYLGQTVGSVNDIPNVCVNIEHSYIGDLLIELECPDGTSIVLHNQEGGGVYLGDPVDFDGSNPTPGTGYNYCWSMQASNENWEDYIDNFALSSGTSLPAGSYQPYESFDDLIGCPLNGEWEVVVTDLLLSDNGFIFGWSIEFEASLYPPGNAITFQPEIIDSSWTSQGVLLGNNGAVTAQANSFPNQAYTYTVVDNFGCSWDTTVIVDVLKLPEPDLLYDPECLDDQPTQMTASSSSQNGAITMTNWQVYSDVYSGNSATHAFLNSGLHDVSIQTEDAKGCVGDSTFQVIVHYEPVADFTNDLACIYEGITFSDLSSVNNVDQLNNWNWDFGDGNFASYSIPQDYTHNYGVVNAFQATLTVTTDKGCVDDTTKQVEIFEQPNSDFTLDTTQGCVELCINPTDISTSATSSIVSWQWDYGNGAGSLSQTPVVCYSESGNYDLKLIVQNAYGCFDTSEIKVFAQPLPEGEYSYSPAPPTILNNRVKFNDETFDAMQWSWVVEDSAFSDQSAPFYTFSDTGSYAVKLIVENSYGCIDSLTKIVDVDAVYMVYIPNSFTPNEDLLNDGFSISTIGIKPEEFSFKIQDRWGKVVYETQNRDFIWDGKADQKLLKNDVYLYEAKLLDVFDNTHEYTGKIILLK